MAVPLRFSGRDLAPIVFESELSVLLRIAWRNVLSPSMMIYHLSCSKNKFALDRQRLLDQFGWVVPEPLLEPDSPSTEIFYIAPAFRYCPICLEAGYHSDLHQCLEIRNCPLHNVPLSMLCHCCASPTPSTVFSKALFERPYYCSRCHEPLSGAEPDLLAHLDFRDASTGVAECLTPYGKWWTAQHSKRVHAFKTGIPDRRSLNATSSERAEFARSLISTETSALCRSMQGFLANQNRSKRFHSVWPDT